MVDINAYANQIIDALVSYAPQIIGALITLIVGFKIINILVNFISESLKKRDFDPSLRSFLKSFIGICLKVILLVSIAGMIGIENTSFIAVLGAAGLAIGLSLQGSLSNFAGGVLILSFKPFKVGEIIECQSIIGTVRKIEIFNTVLNTFDNKTVVIPNAILSNGIITNYSREDNRRLDLVFGISYGDNSKKAIKIIETIVKKHELILADPEPTIRVDTLGDSSVNIATRVWVKNEDILKVKFDLIENVKADFDKKGISIPFPQRDVHMYKEK